MFKNIKEVEEFIYSSYVTRYNNIPSGSDAFVRNPNITREMLDYLGSVDRKQKNIMITGSKGKGSLSVMVAKILEGHGYKIGLFTSPHLRDYTERIRINGKAISENDLIAIADKIKPIYDEIENRLPKHKYIGPVGATAVMAMSYFYENNTDFNVIECGRGARFDDVNQIQGFVGGINKIFLEHVGPLGHSIDEVAHHKAGLIKKPLKAVFSAEQSKYADLVLRYESRKFNIPINIYNQEFSAYDIRLTNNGTEFSVNGKFGKYEDLCLSLLGRHQAENASLAIAISEYVLNKKLDKVILSEILQNIKWPGRMEILEKIPLVVLDGCISRESMTQAKEVIDFLEYKKMIAIVAIPEDKDYLGVIEILKSYKCDIIMTYADNDYLKFTEKQVIEARKIYPVEFINKVSNAIDYAKSQSNENTLILCLGTQSFIKDVKIYYKEDTLNI
ncbi:MAG: Mur ligase family protein [Firmicutes bacterium]|nr:Mur ligase family protein [Bacillota bacterium]